MVACGLDFGTSNTTLGWAGASGAELLALEGEQRVLPSALFFDFESGATLFGRAAVAAYVAGGEGRLMRSIKSVLGTDLIDADTQLSHGRIAFRAVIARFIGEVKARAERGADGPFTAVVHGRPVHFVDGDEDSDGAAEAALAAIARDAGFTEVSFQYEPIAAALDYESRVGGEELALIADIGGGTSDFSVVRIGPDRRGRADRVGDILANAGVRIGGTDFDRDFSLATVMPELGFGSPMKREGLIAPRAPYLDLATWSKINFLYTAKALASLKEIKRESARPDLIHRLLRTVEDRQGHALAMTVEGAKITLSDHATATVPLPAAEETLSVAADDFVTATTPLAIGITTAIHHCLDLAGIGAPAVDAVFLTGGSTLIPHVRTAIMTALPDARVVEGDKFGSVGQGLAIEARRRYGPVT